jgi:hypothetical protein
MPGLTQPGSDWPKFDSLKQLRLAINDGGRTAVESIIDAPDQKQLEFWHKTLRAGGPEAIRIFPLDEEFGKAGLGETVCA